MAATEPISGLEQAVAAIWRTVSGLGYRGALVGGLGVSVRAEPRFTRDVDVAMAAAGDSDAERLVKELTGFGYRVVAVVEQEATHRLATVRLEPPARAGVPPSALVDLLFGSSGIEAELVDRAESIEVFPGLVVPVATVGDLIALKILARDDDRRPQDLVDLRALIRVASLADLEQARSALRLIRARGFHRNRDLELDLLALLP